MDICLYDVNICLYNVNGKTFYSVDVCIYYDTQIYKYSSGCLATRIYSVGILFVSVFHFFMDHFA